MDMKEMVSLLGYETFQGSGSFERIKCPHCERTFDPLGMPLCGAGVCDVCDHQFKWWRAWVSGKYAFLTLSLRPEETLESAAVEASQL